MATTNIAYDGATDTITVTGLDSLGDKSEVTSDAIDNTSDRFVDAIVEFELVGSTSSAVDTCHVFLQQALNGTTYSDADNDELIANVKMNGTTAVRKHFSIAELNGGVMPKHWRLRIYNNSGVALSGSGNSLKIRGVHYTIA